MKRVVPGTAALVAAGPTVSVPAPARASIGLTR